MGENVPEKEEKGTDKDRERVRDVIVRGTREISQALH
jgi:hypothetical protein